jgi:cold shock CspA family protein
MAQQAKRQHSPELPSRYAAKKAKKLKKLASSDPSDEVEVYTATPETKSDNKWQKAKVTFYKIEKGYGFLVLGDTDQAVFVGPNALRKADIAMLVRGDEHEVLCVPGKPYPEVVSIRPSI